MIFTVPSVEGDHNENITHYIKEAQELREKALRSRLHNEYTRSRADETMLALRSYIDTFAPVKLDKDLKKALKKFLSTPLFSDADNARINAQAKKNEEAQKIRDQKALAGLADKIERWRNGENIHLPIIPGDGHYRPLWMYCRDHGVILRTSKQENCLKRELK